MSEQTQLERLRWWQGWLERNDAAMSGESLRMDEREALYRGDVRSIEPLTGKDMNGQRKRRASHVRNVVAENIESQVSSVIPQPKVTAFRQTDEWRAKLLEDLLRNELDRLPFEELNDRMERTVPIQGGGYWLVEWDESCRSRGYGGDVRVSAVHPKQVVPQDGVFSTVEDMDAVVLKLPQTRDSILRRYGVDVSGESDTEPELTGGADDALVTQYAAYYRTAEGGVGKFSWVGDTVLEDLSDCQQRLIRYCRDCGAAAYEGKDCPVCGGKHFRWKSVDYEEIWTEKRTAHGTVIPGRHRETDEAGKTRWVPTRIPYYKPDVYPLFLQRNISLYGRLLGDSDVDKIKDQQNTINRMEQKIIDRLVKAGTRITLPDRADFRVDPEDGEKWYVGSAADRSLIGVYDFSGNLQYEMSYLSMVYEEARQLLGITDSFQGRKDSSAQSGVAKQFAAAQSAGRLESKRVLKEAAYAELFKRIVQLKLAYADEPRPVLTGGRDGEKYDTFDRYDFLEQDENGEWRWILDRFAFSCDVSAPLAGNREKLWENAAAHLRAGAFGDPEDPETLLLYWGKLERLHYPGAAETRAALEARMTDRNRAETPAADMEGKEEMI